MWPQAVEGQEVNGVGGVVQPRGRGEGWGCGLKTKGQASRKRAPRLAPGRTEPALQLPLCARDGPVEPGFDREQTGASVFEPVLCLPSRGCPQDMFAAAVSLVSGRVLFVSGQAASTLGCGPDALLETKFTELLAPHDVGHFHSCTAPFQLPPWNLRGVDGERPGPRAPLQSP